MAGIKIGTILRLKFWRLCMCFCFLLGCGNSENQTKTESQPKIYYEIFENIEMVFKNQKLEVSLLPQSGTEGVSVNIFMNIPDEVKKLYPPEFVFIASHLIEGWETLQTKKMLDKKQFNVIQQSGTRHQRASLQIHFLSQERNQALDYVFQKIMGLLAYPQTSKIKERLSGEAKRVLKTQKNTENIKKINGGAIFSLKEKSVSNILYKYRIGLVKKFFQDLLVFGTVKIFISGNLKKDDASIKNFTGQLSELLLKIHSRSFPQKPALNFRNFYKKHQVIASKKPSASFLFRHKININTAFDLLKWQVLCEVIKASEGGLLSKFFRENDVSIENISANVSENERNHFLIISYDSRHKEVNESLFYYRKFINTLKIQGITERNMQVAKNLQVLAFDKSFINPENLGLTVADYLLFENGETFLKTIFSSLKNIKMYDLNALTKPLSVDNMNTVVIADTTQIPFISWD